jgi:hypothetical protein
VEPINLFKLQELRHEADAFIAKPATSRQILSKVNSVWYKAAANSPENLLQRSLGCRNNL